MTTSMRLVAPLGALFVVACDSAVVMPGGNAGGRGGGGSGAGAGGNNSGAGGSSSGAGGFSIPDAAGSSGTPDAGPGMGDPNGPKCAEDVHDGKILPLDLLFLVDISGSMDETAAMRSKWVAVRDALQAFLRDSGSAGMGAGLQVFPHQAKLCATSADCVGQGSCEQKGVCGPPAMITVGEDTCNAATATMCGFLGLGEPCTEYGLCSKSGLRCSPIGQPCAGMAATCAASARCFAPAAHPARARRPATRRRRWRSPSCPASNR
jgi:hypothetical protein